MFQIMPISMGSGQTEQSKLFENCLDPQIGRFFGGGSKQASPSFLCTQKYWDLYDRNQFKMPPNKEIPPGYPSHAANLKAMEMRKYSDYEGKGPREFSDATNRRLLHGYAAATSYVDACVGKVLDSLRNSGLEKNTIVVLWEIMDGNWAIIPVGANIRTSSAIPAFP